jgi:RNA polymerase sigma factor (sigma-70 family)
MLVAVDSGADASHTPPTTPEALARLVARRAEFLSFLERRMGSREAAEELLQEAFVKGIERSGTIRDGESAVAWFYRLLRNAVVDRARRRAAADRSLERLSNELADAVHLDASLQQSVCACVSGLVDTLKPDYASALRAVDIDGRSVGDFAQDAGITSNNAAVRLHRARAALGERLRTFCGACATHGCVDCCCV